MSGNKYIGIDFGTCNTNAAILVNGNLVYIRNQQNQSFSFPSTVLVTDKGEVLTGTTADKEALNFPETYRLFLKKDVLDKIPKQLYGDRYWHTEVLLGIYLQNLKMVAEEQLGETLSAAVLTIPAGYSGGQRQMMTNAAKVAGFSEVELLVEPVAAAKYLAYSSLGSKLGESATILVYDLGGGTFDVALIEKQGQEYQIQGIDSDRDLGGNDFDVSIGRYFREEFPEIEVALTQDSSAEEFENSIFTALPAVMRYSSSN